MGRFGWLMVWLLLTGCPIAESAVNIFTVNSAADPDRLFARGFEEEQR